MSDLSSGLLKLAIKEATRSTFDFRLGAVIFERKDRVISSGCNFQNRFRRNLKPSYTSWIGSLHAEVDAILNARENLHGKSMLVIRLGKLGELRLSKPCKHCMLYISNVGIKKVIYSIDDTTFGVINNFNF